MKTPEEIKKGLECCRVGDCDCENCPYKHKKSCMHYLKQDAIAYILQLERERDAAVEEMTELMQLLHYCRYCKHLTDDGECTNDFADTDGMPWRCWQWRGVQEVASDGE